MNLRERPKIDTTRVVNATWQKSEHLRLLRERVEKVTADADKEKRLAVMECVMCFVPYGAGRMGGAMCMSVECGVCDTILRFGSTCTDELCVECAKRLNLCKHCGADIGLKQRRKKRDFTPPTKEKK